MDQRIRARIAALEAELLSLKQAVADGVEHDAPATSDRRGMVKLLAASAVGAVTGAAILGAQPAAAVDGNPVLQGQTNAATNTTTLTSSAGTALVAYGGGGYGVQSDGGIANALFAGSGDAPVGGASGLGELYVDQNGDWWAGTADAAPDGVWRKIAGPATAGQLHLLPVPVRVYDSRPGQPPDSAFKFPMIDNTPRSIDTTFNNSGVPKTANAVLVTLTASKPHANGYVAAWASGPWPGTSNLNFTFNQDIATTTIVRCGPSAVVVMQASVSTDLIVDVLGYYQ